MANDTYSWYEIQLEGLGESFLDKLETGYKRILANPTYFSFLENEFRRIPFIRFPYIIICLKLACWYILNDMTTSD
jgi:hypothetical protein